MNPLLIDSIVKQEKFASDQKAVLELKLKQINNYLEWHKRGVRKLDDKLELIETLIENNCGSIDSVAFNPVAFTSIPDDETKQPPLIVNIIIVDSDETEFEMSNFCEKFSEIFTGLNFGFNVIVNPPKFNIFVSSNEDEENEGDFVAKTYDLKIAIF